MAATVGGFGSIRGQAQALATLSSELRRGRVAQAYLFSGPPGVGKERVALGLAKALNCDRRATGESLDDFCGACRPCRLANGGNHPDVLRVTAAEGKTQIAVGSVREALGALPYRPHEGRSRIVVVPEAHALTTEAQNALLKSLEEPPRDTHFILVTSAPHALLATVRSRCEEVRFSALGRADLEAIVIEHGASAEQAALVATVAAGSAERALALVGQTDAIAEQREAVRALDRAADSPGATAALAAAAGWTDREDARSLCEMMLGYLRDVTVLAFAPGAPDAAADPDLEARIVNQDLLGELRERARTLGPRALGRLAVVAEAIEALDRNANVQLTLERMALTMAEVAP